MNELQFLKKKCMNNREVLKKAKVIMKESNIKTFEHFSEFFRLNENNQEWENQIPFEVSY